MQDLMGIIFSWDALWYLLMLLYVPACLGLIIIVLLQKGKGMGLAGAFGGGGGAETVFGPRTSRSLPQRLTYAMAGIFMAMAIVLSLLSGRVNRGAAPELVTADEASAIQSQSLDALFEEGSDATATTEDAGEAPADVTPVEVTPMVDGNAVVIDPTGTMSEDDAKAAAGSVDESAAPAEAVSVDTPTEEAPAADAPMEEAPAAEAATEAPADAEAATDPAAEAPAEAPADAPAAEEAPAAADSTEQPQ